MTWILVIYIYGGGLLVKVRLSDPSEVEELMDREAYEGSLA